MIVLKTSRELKVMREAGRIAANALKIAGAAVKPGVSTWEIDHVAHNYIVEQGAVPTFLGYGGFPASACVSVNNV
ncbi:MAG TPA: type I methionyl aminopeptidase, partial [Ruminococcaceae bacterium]|nr:type I methionyl aminopeptidase [Oscillospiraceae bacterium]